MMNFKTLQKGCLLVTLFFTGQLLNAQRLIPEDELFWETRYDPVTLKDANPDSVYYFTYSGPGVGEDITDSVFDLSALLKCRNLQRLEIRDLDATGLFSKLGNFPMLQYLDAGNTGVEYVPAEIFNCKNLKTLILWNMTFPEDLSAFEICRNLRKIDFYEVNFPGDEEGEVIFNWNLFPSLEELSLGYSNISNLSGLENCKSLKKLDLFSNDNFTLLDVSANINLEKFRITDCYSLSEAPLGLENLSLLKEMVISNVVFPLSAEMFGQHPDMEYLEIKSCGLENVDFITQMPHLRHFDFSDNSVTTLPDDIGKCTELTEFIANGNPIASLPASFFDLVNLADLELTGAAITIMPASLAKLSNLSTLDLRGAEIAYFEPGALNLPALYTLTLSYTKIRQVPSDIAKLKNLHTLELNGDSLKMLPAALFSLDNLHYLNLESNQLTALPKGWASLTQLSSLNLGSNKLSKLPADLLKLDITFFTLEDNQFKSLPSGLSKMPKLSFLYLGGNAHLKYLKGLEKAPGISLVYLRAVDFTEKELSVWRSKLGEKLVVLSE